jgi:hypothetical protein
LIQGSFPRLGKLKKYTLENAEIKRGSSELGISSGQIDDVTDGLGLQQVGVLQSKAAFT